MNSNELQPKAFSLLSIVTTRSVSSVKTHEVITARIINMYIGFIMSVMLVLRLWICNSSIFFNYFVCISQFEF